MEEIDYSKLHEIFNRYSAYLNYEVETETHNVGFAGTAMQYQMVGQTTIKMSAVFHSPHRFVQFTKDMIRLEEITDEEYLRRHNPTLQRAYEEYQLLLKLSK